MKKRGLTLTAIIQFILGATIIVFFMHVGKTYGSGEVYAKSQLAKDIALLLDTMYTLPGNVDILYYTTGGKYSIEINGDRVKVYEIEREMPEITYTFVNALPAPLYIDAKKPKSIFFSKIGDDIIIDTDERGKKPGLDKISCRSFQTPIDINTLDTKTIVNLYASSKDQFRLDDPALRRAGIVILSYPAENPNTELNNLRAFVPIQSHKLKPSMYLACLLINNIIDSEIIDPTGTSITPMEEIKPVRADQVLIYLEIGNKNYAGEKIEATPAKIRAVIQQALEGA